MVAKLGRRARSRGTDNYAPPIESVSVGASSTREELASVVTSLLSTSRPDLFKIPLGRRKPRGHQRLAARAGRPLAFTCSAKRRPDALS
jgi:hypothetical protein